MQNEILRLINAIKPASEYEKIRKEAYRAISSYKAPRYLKLTDRLTILFEDAATVWFQIEETIHMEGTDDEQMIREIISTYQPMIPSHDEVSFTLFIHVYNDDEMRRLLPRYSGIERGIGLSINDNVIKPLPIYPSDYEPGAQARSIHYLKYKSNGLAALLMRTNDVTILVDHSEVKAKVKIPGEALASLRNSITIDSIKWIV
ncbi:MAG: DUF3501 family protein [Thermocladium sp.]